VQSVRDVLVRLLRRNGGSGSRRHERHRTPLLAAAALVAGAAVTGLTTGLTTGPAIADAEDPVTFTVGTIGDADSFNPFLGYQAISYDAWALEYDFLVGYKMTDMSPAPALAETWETSDDGLTWTFHMREGVTWNDGEPLTAADVAYTYNRVLTEKVAGGTWRSYIKNATSVTATDDTTVVMQLSTPSATLPLMPIPIVPEHIWKDVSKDDLKHFANEPTDGQPIVGSGPFMFVEGTAGGSTYKFVKNPNYWGEGPYVDQVVFQVYKSQDPMVQALIKGEIDFAEDITPLQVKALDDDAGITAHNGISPIFDEIAFNTGSIDIETGEPLGDPNPAVLDQKFRHALGYAVDTEQLVRTAYQGAAEPGTSIMLPSYPTWHWEPPDDVKFTFDLDKAAEELDAAGYVMGGNGKRTLPDGSPIGTLRLFARAESKQSVDTLDLFQSWLGQLGIDAEVTAMDSSALGDRILEGTYDVFQWNWYIEPDPDGILGDFTCEQLGNLNDSWYCDEEYDAMYAAQGVEMDKDARVEIVHQMQQQLYEDAPYIVTAYTTTGEAVRSDKFACFQPQPDPGGVWLYQYGGRNYSLLRPAAEAGDCDGTPTALGAVAADGSSTGTGTPGAAVEAGGGNTMGGFLVGVLSTLVVVAGFWGLQRRRTVDDRE
jgi:peptide/nickel transport system substrate-binding protein